MSPTAAARIGAASSATRPAARWLAVGFLVATLLLAVASLLLIAAVIPSGRAADSNDQQLLAELSLGASYAVVGWLVASRRSENPLGWVYLGIGLSQVGEGFVGLASLYGLVVAPGSIPGADVFAWIGTWAWVPGFSLLLSFSLLLFPSGRLPSRRWRPVTWLAVVAIALLGIPLAVAAWPLRGVGLVDGSVAPPDWVNALEAIGLLAIVVVAILSVASIVVRFRRSAGLERRQLEWFTWAVVPVVAFLVSTGFVTYPPAAWILIALFIAPLLPLAIGIAILRYRLYEIDRIVSRTISYAVVTAVLVGVFAGAILLLQTLLASLTGANTIAVAGSTLVVAALFQPLRRRVQRAVDLRFNRARYDAERTAESFAARLRDQVDLATVSADLARTAAATLVPASVGLWIREPEAGR